TFSGVSANTGVGTDDTGDLLTNLQGASTTKLIAKAQNFVQGNSNSTQQAQSQVPGFQAAAAIAIDEENNSATATIAQGALARAAGNLTVDAVVNNRPSVLASSGDNAPADDNAPPPATQTEFAGSLAVAIGTYSNTATSLIDAGATVDAG